MEITVTKSDNGKFSQETSDIEALVIPDLWHIGMRLKTIDSYASDQVLNTWYLCHALKQLAVKQSVLEVRDEGARTSEVK